MPDTTKLKEIARTRMAGIYTPAVIEHATNPHNWGKLTRASGFARCTIDGGENIEFSVQIKNGAIEAARFTTDGCAATIACVSMATDLLLGRTLAQALALKPADIVNALDQGYTPGILPLDTCE